MQNASLSCRDHSFVSRPQYCMQCAQNQSLFAIKTYYSSHQEQRVPIQNTEPTSAASMDDVTQGFPHHQLSLQVERCYNGQEFHPLRSKDNQASDSFSQHKNPISFKPFEDPRIHINAAEAKFRYPNQDLDDILNGYLDIDDMGNENNIPPARDPVQQANENLLSFGRIIPLLPEGGHAGTGEVYEELNSGVYDDPSIHGDPEWLQFMGMYERHPHDPMKTLLQSTPAWLFGQNDPNYIPDVSQHQYGGQKNPSRNGFLHISQPNTTARQPILSVVVASQAALTPSPPTHLNKQPRKPHGATLGAPSFFSNFPRIEVLDNRRRVRNPVSASPRREQN
jgi:hypothetical protein